LRFLIHLRARSGLRAEQHIFIASFSIQRSLIFSSHPMPARTCGLGQQRGEGKPETFTFLGFTHYCGKRRKDGAFIVWRETAKKRLVAKLHAIKLELQHRRHEPVATVGAWLQKVTTGYYQYHAVPGNLERLQLFRWRLRWIWWHALSRRSQRSRMPMDRLTRLVNRWIPFPRVLHPYPMCRFDATHPRREPHA
jgi:RNA-directed DNA polymerase